MPLSGFKSSNAPVLNTDDKAIAYRLYDYLHALSILDYQSARFDVYSGTSAKFKVKSSALERKFEVPGPKIRAMIHYLRCNSIPICSSSDGYWIARIDFDIQTTIESIKQRIRSLSRMCAGLERGAARINLDPSKTEYLTQDLFT